MTTENRLSEENEKKIEEHRQQLERIEKEEFTE